MPGGSSTGASGSFSSTTVATNGAGAATGAAGAGGRECANSGEAPARWGGGALRQSSPDGAGGGDGWRGGLAGALPERAGCLGGAADPLPRSRGGALRQSASVVPDAAVPAIGSSSGFGSSTILAECVGGFQPAGFWCHGLSGTFEGALGSAGSMGTTCPTEPVFFGGSGGGTAEGDCPSTRKM